MSDNIFPFRLTRTTSQTQQNAPQAECTTSMKSASEKLSAIQNELSEIQNQIHGTLEAINSGDIDRMIKVRDQIQSSE